MSEQSAREYRYGMRNRPAMYGTAPEGWRDGGADERDPNNPFVTVIYDRPLTADELYRYEMYPVNDEAYNALGFEIGGWLLHGPDLGQIVRFETRGYMEVLSPSALHQWRTWLVRFSDEDIKQQPLEEGQAVYAGNACESHPARIVHFNYADNPRRTIAIRVRLIHTGEEYDASPIDVMPADETDWQ